MSNGREARMAIGVQHSTINEGVETRLDVSMTPIRERPRTGGGLRCMSDVQMTVPRGSTEDRLLHRASYATEPIRLRVEDHDAMWSIKRRTGRSDGPTRLTLGFIDLSEAGLTGFKEVG